MATQAAETVFPKPIPTAASQGERKIVVFGATNSAGFHLCEVLSSYKIPFRAGVKSNTKHEENLRLLRRMESQADFDLAEVDWNRPDTVRDFLKGAERIFLRTPVGKTVDATRVFLDCIKGRLDKIKSLVFFSVLGAEGGGKDQLGREFAEAEKMISQSGISNYIIVRPSFLFSNLIEFNAPSIRNERNLVHCLGGDTQLNIISDEDVTSFIVPLLLTDNFKEHAGKTYHPSNVRLYTMKDFSKLISAGLGYDISMKEVSPEEFEKILIKLNRTPDVARIYLEFMKFAREGGFTNINQDFKKLLGKNPMELQEMVQKNIQWFRNIPVTKQTISK